MNSNETTLLTFFFRSLQPLMLISASPVKAAVWFDLCFSAKSEQRELTVCIQVQFVAFKFFQIPYVKDIKDQATLCFDSQRLSTLKRFSFKKKKMHEFV